MNKHERPETVSERLIETVRGPHTGTERIVTEELLAAGADVNDSTQLGTTPLHLACCLKPDLVRCSWSTAPT